MGQTTPQRLNVLGLVTKLLLLLLHISLSRGSEMDVACLESIKDAMEDPRGSLSSWNFTTSYTKDSICSFVGIDCWNDQENKVMTISLAGKGLRGTFPRGLAYCTSLTALDLSSNDLYGEIPSDISNLVPYVTILKLSSNSFTREIPGDLSNCLFLNELELNDNHFSGQIPAEIGSLNRLIRFSVANNDLNGSVPTSIGAKFPAKCFDHNEMLCGSPLAPCRQAIPLIRTPEFIAGASISGVIFCALSFIMGIYFFIHRVPASETEGEPDGEKCKRRIKRTQIKVSKSESTLTESEFKELAKATNNFSKEHIIGFGNATSITLYKAALKNGSVYTVKRLQYTARLLKECSTKMATMGSVRHPNLVPLLGYCVANKELFSVYEHMPNGSLFDQLHSSDENCSIREWPLTRLKIAVGAAKGLAWLHHYCNPRIIHQNISSRCILLDADFVPKVSDFGLVTLTNQINGHWSDDSGYLAPEHARTQNKTPKRDVYSFGVVLLELITGEMPNYVAKARRGFSGSLVEWVMQLSNSSELKEAVDPRLVGKGYDDELIQFLKIGCTCVALDPNDRPSMYQAHRLLTATLDRHHVLPEVDDLFTSNA